MPAMMLLLFKTPSLFTSKCLKQEKVPRMSCSVTFPNRTNIAKENISRVHSSRPSVRFVVNRSRWISGPVASSRKAASSKWSPNCVNTARSIRRLRNSNGIMLIDDMLFSNNVPATKM